MGKLKVDLLGTSFTIQANEETEYLEKLLGYYKRITDDVQKIDTVKTPLQISILSGIMLCDELYKEKTNKLSSELNNQSDNSSTSELEKRTIDMIEKINKVL
ncbi:MAG: cell division protein ZapA [Treponema sp.]|nr:cell division protein ZapA [Treponema sp.]